MNTDVLPVDPRDPETATIARAAAILREGGLVAFPTETVYGLGSNALDETAVAGIFRAKGRPPANPVIVHVADANAARALVREWPEAAERLAGRFWPGPLTLVLPRGPAIPDVVAAGGPTVGIRCPAHPVALALIRASDLPIAAPSANRSSSVSPTTAEHVLRSLRGRVHLVLDAGPTPGGVESTVLDLASGPPVVLRPGLVTPSQIAGVLGVAVGTRAGNATAGVLRSPGLLSRHYAPAARLELTDGDGRDRVEALAREGVSTGWMPIESAGGRPPAPPGVVVAPMPASVRAYARRLYAALHALDAAGVQSIVVGMPPDGEEWGAIRDRLQRAAAPEWSQQAT